MPRQSRSRSPRRRRRSRSPIQRRRSEHDRHSARERERDREKVDRRRRHGSHEPHASRGGRQRSNEKDTHHHESVKSDEVSQKAWQIDVHPSRLTDLGLNTEVDENFTNRTDRFANERFKNTTQPVKLPIRDDRLERRGRGRGRGERRSRWGMDDRRRGDDRSDRSRRGEDRSDRSRVESGERRQKEESGVNKTGDLAAGERKHESERTDQQMVDEIKMEEDNEAGDGERRGRQMDGRRGRGRRGRMREKSREEREKEDREFQEKRLLDSLTDPRDVPKGTSYFEHDDRESGQTKQPSRRYSTGDDRLRRDRNRRDWDRGRDRRGRDRGSGRWLDDGRDRGGRDQGSERWLDDGRDRGERTYRQRSPQVWRHDMFEVLQKEEEGEGVGEEDESLEEDQQDMDNIRQRRSVVHRLGTRDDTGSRQDHRGPRDAGIDGTWSHDKFQKHDQLVSYPIHHQAILEQREERAMEGEVEKDENREHTDNAMDTM